MMKITILILILTAAGVVLLSEGYMNCSYKMDVGLVFKKAIILSILMVTLLFLCRNSISVFLLLLYGLIFGYMYQDGQSGMYLPFLAANTVIFLTAPFALHMKDTGKLQAASTVGSVIHAVSLFCIGILLLAAVSICLIQIIRKKEKPGKNIYNISGILFLISFLLAVLDLLFGRNPAIDIRHAAAAIGIIAENILLCILIIQKKREAYLIQAERKETEQKYEALLTLHHAEAKQLHDRNYHIQMLKHYLEEDKINQALAYLNELEESGNGQKYRFFEDKTKERIFEKISQKSSSNDQNREYSGNDIVDYILAEKKALARENGIRVFYDISILPADLPMRSGDLCCLLSNVLDNMLEAAVTFCRLTIESHGEMLMLEAKNDFQKAPQAENGRLLSSKKNTLRHGYGFQIMEEIVTSYHGIITYDMNEKQFCLRILLNL